MTTPSAPLSHLLIVSRGAGGVDDDVEARLTAALPDFEIMAFDADVNVTSRLSPGATVVVAGGDGTIGVIARQLAGADAILGIISRGTYNNFARALGLPEDLDAAINVLLHGRPRPVTLGLVGDRHFLEIGAVGLFGEAINLGEAVKESGLAGMPGRLAAVVGATAFDYTITGDIESHGRALSLVISNTPTTGTHMAVGDSTPVDPVLTINLDAGATRTDLVRRLVTSVLSEGSSEDDETLAFRRVTISTDPPVSVYADTERVGETPITVTAAAGALRVLLP